jgi:uncharacterized damage-inducible protein DinB
MNEIARIEKMLAGAYDGNAWHGPNVKSTLAKINAGDKDARIGNGHSIIELVGHMAAWRHFVAERLKGNAGFQVTDENNFPVIEKWETALQSLEETQKELLSAIKQCTEEKLLEEVPTRKYNFYTLLHGIIQHDIYHIGQIVMIQKSLT